MLRHKFIPELELQWNANSWGYSYTERVSSARRETVLYNGGETEANGVYEQGVEGEYLD